MKAGAVPLALPAERYPALTGVRAVGACCVFFDHFPFQPDAHITINVMAFFFVLSGFLIVRIYYGAADASRAWLTGYFINRFARIYPVSFLLLSVAVPPPNCPPAGAPPTPASPLRDASPMPLALLPPSPGCVDVCDSMASCSKVRPAPAPAGASRWTELFEVSTLWACRSRAADESA